MAPLHKGDQVQVVSTATLTSTGVLAPIDAKGRIIEIDDEGYTVEFENRVDGIITGFSDRDLVLLRGSTSLSTPEL
jgi:hypothetical protein